MTIQIRPLPRIVQQINALLHREPISTVAYGVYWSIFLIVAAPLSVFVLQVHTMVQVLLWIYDNYLVRGSNSKKDDGSFSDSTKTRKKNSSSQTEFAIVITGCDSGFGKDIAIRAAQDGGYTVFACCLHKESFGQFQELSNNCKDDNKSNEKASSTAKGKIIPLQMDVTNDKEVNEAVNKVKSWLCHQEGGQEGRQEEALSKSTTTKGAATKPSKTSSKSKSKPTRVLHALLNNAGTGRQGEIDWMKMSDFHTCMEVNYFGTVRCCKAFLPILKDQAIHQTYEHARILNLVSVAGIFAGGQGGSAYIASKHATQSFTTCLRLELEAFGIRVVAIHPTFHKTAIVDSIADNSKRTWDACSPELKEQYGQDFFERFKFLCAELVHGVSWDSNVVVNKVLSYLSMDDPPREDIIGTDGRFLFAALRMLPAWFIEPLCLLGLKRPIPAAMKHQHQQEEQSRKQVEPTKCVD